MLLTGTFRNRLQVRGPWLGPHVPLSAEVGAAGTASRCWRRPQVPTTGCGPVRSTRRAKPGHSSDSAAQGAGRPEETLRRSYVVGGGVEPGEVSVDQPHLPRAASPDAGKTRSPPTAMSHGTSTTRARSRRVRRRVTDRPGDQVVALAVEGLTAKAIGRRLPHGRPYGGDPPRPRLRQAGRALAPGARPAPCATLRQPRSERITSPKENR
jgi:hypothetical protein